MDHSMSPHSKGENITLRQFETGTISLNVFYTFRDNIPSRKLVNILQLYPFEGGTKENTFVLFLRDYVVQCCIKLLPLSLNQ